MTKQRAFAHDVFISYSRRDQVWVRGTLLPRLEQAGLRIFTGAWDGGFASASVVEGARAIASSARTLLILTPAYCESDWPNFERIVLQAVAPAARDRRLVPLLYERCALPARLERLARIDWTGPDQRDLAWTQLLTALGAPPVQQAPDIPAHAGWRLIHPYPTPPHFTGRTAERAALTEWLNAENAPPLLLLQARGGSGKSALAWHWLLHDVDPRRWRRVVWWSFLHDRNLRAFLGETLNSLEADPGSLGLRQQADALLELLRQPGILLVLDGFERALHAYSGMTAAYQGDEPAREAGSHAPPRDCISPAAEHLLRALAVTPGLRSRVLLTTRLTPRALETREGLLRQGCQKIELAQMQPADAAVFLRRQGIRGAQPDLERACASCGCHPLSLRLLAGRIVHDRQQPGDIAVATRLNSSGDGMQHPCRVFRHAYESLAPAQRELLGQVACLRGPVAGDTLRALAGQAPAPASTAQPGGCNLLGQLLRRKQEADRGPAGDVPSNDGPALDAQLHELVNRGLLHYDRSGRYDLHPIVRRYAYDRLEKRQEAHDRLRAHYAALPAADPIRRLEDLAPIIECYHHTVLAGQYEEAWTLFRDRMWQTLYYQLGAYQTQIDLLQALFVDGTERPPRLEDEAHQGHAMNELARSYSLTGQPRRSVPLYECAATLLEHRGDPYYLAVVLAALATEGYLSLGMLQAGETILRRQIAICQEIEDAFWEAVGHQELSRLLTYRGAWDEAEAELALSTRHWEQAEDTQGLCIDEAYRAFRALMMARAEAALTPGPSPADSPQMVGRRSVDGRGERVALHAARRALELSEETVATGYLDERDHVRAHWLLGAAYRANGDGEAANHHLDEALRRCRRIGAIDLEADILLDMARLLADAGRAGQANRLAREAQLVTHRCGYVLPGADAHLLLARLALEGGDRAAALAHASEARRLAVCDGPPAHTYRAASEEAWAILQELAKEGRHRREVGVTHGP
jgi:tetratricopeptide (TPR) repeat protein